MHFIAENYTCAQKPGPEGVGLNRPPGAEGVKRTGVKNLAARGFTPRPINSHPNLKSCEYAPRLSYWREGVWTSHSSSTLIITSRRHWAAVGPWSATS